MLAAKGKGRVLAGGTDLLVQMKSGMVAPGVIVDVKKIPEMTTITETKGSFRIGAATPAAVVGEHKKLKKTWPGVVEAINLIGSTQVQGRASAGGNLCNASPAADSVPALVAAGAVVTIQGPKTRRQVPVEKFAVGPGKTTLKPGEIVVSLTLPARPRGAGDAYLRLIPRTEMDIAVVGCGVSLVMKGDTCVSARVGLGAVAPTVLLVEAAGKALTGSKLDDAALDAAANACSAACRPIDDKRGTIRYRTKNGAPTEFLCEPNQTLLDALRDNLGLTGSKEGCGSGDCGACSVTIDGRLVCSCLVLAPEAQGAKVETIEGMASGDKLHPLQKKFIEMAALQCGICTPGFLVASRALLERNNNPTETEVRFWLAGNLCRCTGYDKIIHAVLDVAAEMRETAK
jgi:carbon-monoxide dehydrogenase medium subunit